MSTRLSRGWFLFPFGFLFLLALASIPLVQLWRTAASPSPPPPPQAIAVWANLPTPTLSRPEWQSWANPLPVRDVLVHEGLLWAATGGGLMGWDLATADYAHFRAEHGLPSHELTALAVDAQGQLWVGSHTAGVARYDGRTWHTFTTTAGLPSNTIYDLALTPAGQLLAGTAAGLSQFDPDRQQWQPMGRTLWQMRPVPIRAILPERAGLWLATPQGVEWTDGRTWHTFTTADGLPSNNITALALTAEGVWAGTSTGLAWWDGDTWNAIPTLRHPVLSLHTTADGALWVGNATGTSHLADSTAIPHFFPLAGTTFLRDVQAIWPAADGVWLATTTGVHWLNAGGDWRTLPLPTAPTLATSWHEAQGELWLTTAEGVYQFDGANWDYLPALAGRPTNQLTALGTDNEGGLLAAFNTPAQGVLYRPAGGDWVERGCVTGAGGHVYGSTVRNIQWTASGTGWLIAHDGVFRLAPQGAGWRCDFLTAEGYLTPSHTAVWGESLFLLQGGALWVATPTGLAQVQEVATAWQALAHGGDGALWLASATTLARYDGQAWVQFDGGWPLPPTAVIRQIAVQNSHTIWLATDEGLVQYADGRWLSFTTAAGLPSDDIHHLHLASSGEIWLATPSGIGVKR